MSTGNPKRVVRRDPFRFTTPQRLWFVGIYGILFVSGAAWVIFHQFFVTDGEFGAEIHPGERWSLIIHGGAAMAACVMLGAILVFHVKRAWLVGRNRTSGAILLVLNFLLVSTGFLFYYGGGEMNRDLLRWIHLALGFGYPIILPIHIILGRAKPQSTAIQGFQAE